MTTANLPDPASRRLVIEPSKGWAALRLHEIWEYRDLLYFMIWRDIKARYRQTALGPLWIVLQPLMSMVLYTLVFGVIARLPSEGQPYILFSYTALLPWQFFSDSFAHGVSGLTSGMSMSAKVYFPRLIIPLSKILSSLLDFSISMVILTVMLLFYGVTPSWGVLLLPLFLFIAGLTGLGFGIWFAGPIVKYRDVGQLTSYLTRAWMYSVPVVYSIEIIPPQWRQLYRLNPMTGVIEGFRWALLGTGQPPDWLLLAVSASVSLIVLVGGLFVYRRVERSIVDVA